MEIKLFWIYIHFCQHSKNNPPKWREYIESKRKCEVYNVLKEHWNEEQQKRVVEKWKKKSEQLIVGYDVKKRDVDLNQNKIQCSLIFMHSLVHSKIMFVLSCFNKQLPFSLFGLPKNKNIKIIIILSLLPFAYNCFNTGWTNRLTIKWINYRLISLTAEQY